MPPSKRLDRWTRAGAEALAARSASSAEDARRLLRVSVEAASGFEPESRGFADLRLDHLATPPRTDHYRRLRMADQDIAGGDRLTSTSVVTTMSAPLGRE